MNQMVGVKVVQSLEHGDHDHPDAIFRKRSFSIFAELREWAAAAIIKYEVGILLIGVDFVRKEEVWVTLRFRRRLPSSCRVAN